VSTDFDEATWVAERLPEVDDPDGLATDRARLALLEHISASPHPGRRRSRRGLGLRLAAVGAVTAAVGVVVVGHGPARHPTTATTSVPRMATAPEPHRVNVHPLLLRLADDVTQAPAPPGNATLVVRHHTFPNSPSFWGYDLYEDNGDYYYGATLEQLHQALADPSSGDKELGGILTAAARSANLTPAQAASNVYRASPAPSGPSVSWGMRTALAKLLAAKRSPALVRELRRLAAFPAKPSAHGASETPSQATIDNYLWGNCMDALEGGAGQADVRAGAMLALSTLPDVKVTRTSFDGNPVVQITNTQFSDNYAETLDLDAQTGVLVHMNGGTIGQPDSVDVTYHVTRVTTPSLDPAH
jgi:hypothetical protein